MPPGSGLATLAIQGRQKEAKKGSIFFFEDPSFIFKNFPRQREINVLKQRRETPLVLLLQVVMKPTRVPSSFEAKGTNVKKR